MRTPPGGDGGRRGPSGRVALDVDILSFVSLSLALISSPTTLDDVDKRETRIEREGCCRLDMQLAGMGYSGSRGRRDGE